MKLFGSKKANFSSIAFDVGKIGVGTLVGSALGGPLGGSIGTIVGGSMAKDTGIRNVVVAIGALGVVSALIGGASQAGASGTSGGRV